MRVVVTGASGLIGSSLVETLEGDGVSVQRMVRRPGIGTSEISWDPETGRFKPVGLEGVDAVVHLAGENIASGRWTPDRKKRIRDSRVEGTKLMVRGLMGLTRPPAALVSASATGFYGSSDHPKDERSAPGAGFLADVCRDWESAAESASAKGIRVVRLRFGVVLSAKGGALAQMLRVFRLGLGGRVGSGRQWMSWITIDDAIAAIRQAIESRDLAGAVNVVAPRPVTNSEFTAALGRVLRRPAVLPVPGALLRLGLGEMADELLLSSSRVLPRVLQDRGHRFVHPELDRALGALVG